MILWGPPGVGQDDAGALIARSRRVHRFEALSAVLGGRKDMREAVERAQERAPCADASDRLRRRDPPLQQGAAGRLPALRRERDDPADRRHHREPLVRGELARCSSRATVGVSEAAGHRVAAAARAARATAERGLAARATPTPATRSAHGRACRRRRAARAQRCWRPPRAVAGEAAEIDEAVDRGAARARQLRRYDKAGEQHYDLISALHKSVRGSDPDAAVYWLARMLDAGEDPRFVARRVMLMAVEDIGLADAGACGWRSTRRGVRAPRHARGRPGAGAGGGVPLAALRRATRSTRPERSARLDDVERTAAEPVPLHLRNAPTELMQQARLRPGYRYAHDEAEGLRRAQLLPRGHAARRRSTARRRAAWKRRLPTSWRSCVGPTARLPTKAIRARSRAGRSRERMAMNAVRILAMREGRHLLTVDHS